MLAFAWLAYPYTAFALQSNSNDSLVAALLAWSLALFARPLARGALLALAALAKFAPAGAGAALPRGRARAWASAAPARPSARAWRGCARRSPARPRSRRSPR